ncbi:ead/Ea22-like family protein [Enterobacter roggenkampii]|uniref:ead/Ea22-like family protein n=1 Tax=Enterobacter roggenkampii TaxID=1812935 RepID=UPI00388E65E3
MSNIDKHIDKQALRQLAVDAKELAIIKRYTKGIEAQKKFIAEMTPATVLALLDELEAAEKRIAELEDIAKSVKFDPIPMEDLGNKSDGKKHPYMFGAGYNSAVVHCESVLLQAFAAAAGKGD